MEYFKEAIAWLFGIGLFVNAGIFLPQLYKIWKEKNIKGLSLLTFGFFCVMQFLGVIYGILKPDKVLAYGMWASLVTCGAVTLSVIYLRYFTEIKETHNGLAILHITEQLSVGYQIDVRIFHPISAADKVTIINKTVEPYDYNYTQGEVMEMLKDFPKLPANSHCDLTAMRLAVINYHLSLGYKVVSMTADHYETQVYLEMPPDYVE